tara:strand:+ start:306 stop:1085 length:780 start_codon:yes stop_codon:yes gene_type:complete
VKKYSSPVDIIKYYDDYIKERNESNRKERYEGNEHWYHASGAGSCSRKLYYESVVKAEVSNPINVDSLRLMRLGTIVHNDIQKALTLYNNNVYNNVYNNVEKKININLQKKEIKFYVEGEVTIPELNVRGFYDIVTEQEKVYLFDVKTSGSYAWSKKFGRKKEFNPSIHYELQLGTYAYAIEKEFGRIDGMYLLFYNKDTSRMRPVEIPLTYKSRAYLFWKNINDEHKMGLPDFRVGISPVQKWQCNYCQFKDHCNPPT